MNFKDRLNNLVNTKQLAHHQPDRKEIQQHLHMVQSFLQDAKKQDNSPETRFNVGYSAGHQLLLVALKLQGYRTTNEKGHRFILYNMIDDLLPGAANAKDPLSRAHNLRNKAEYDGDPIDVTEGLLKDIISAVENVKEEVDHMVKQFMAAQSNAEKLQKAQASASPSSGTSHQSSSNHANKDRSQYRGR